MRPPVRQTKFQSLLACDDHRVWQIALDVILLPTGTDAPNQID